MDNSENYSSNEDVTLRDDSGIEVDKVEGRDYSSRLPKANTPPPKPSRKTLLPRNLLTIPNKSSLIENQPLVHLEEDSSEDEIELPLPLLGNRRKLMQSKKAVNVREMMRNDGYSLDMLEEEDLDLIPPRPLDERCACLDSCRACSCGIM